MRHPRRFLIVVLPYILRTGKLTTSKLRSFRAFPYGVLSIATYLTNKLGDTLQLEILDCNLEDPGTYLARVARKLNEFSPDVVGLSMMFDNSYGQLKPVTDKIREFNPRVPILLGGAAATSSSTVILENNRNIDAVCFYEGEVPLLQYFDSDCSVGHLESNAAWITRKSITRGVQPKKSLLQNLDEVVNLDYRFVDISDYEMKEAFSPFSAMTQGGRQFFLLTSRGCPFACAYCMHSGDSDKSLRYASVDKIVAHVADLVTRYGMTVLTIYDDQLLYNVERARRLFRDLAQFHLRIECPNGLSVQFMDEELISLMRKAGMDTVHLAIESGHPYVLNKLMRKPLTLARVKPIVDILRKYDFWVQGYFVSGMPGETDEHRDETVKFIKDVGLDWAGFTLAIPSRGSQLYKMCIENGYIAADLDVDALDVGKFIIETPEYSAEYVTKKTYLMNLDVNFVNNRRMSRGEYEISVRAFLDVIRRYDGHAFAYYYLALALQGCKADGCAVETARNRCKEIAAKEATWREYFDYFGIRI